MPNPLLRKLEKWCPTHYDVHWDPSIPNQPPRFKLTTPNLSAQKLNKLWAEVVSIVTNSNYIVTSNYIRISVIFEEYTVATSIFPTGCIMFQGNNVLKWLDRFIVRICRKINSKINDPSLIWSRDVDEVSPESLNEISVEGLCMICNGRDNGEMLLCENPQCCTWSHAICEGFTEENPPSFSPYLCPVCMKNDITKKVLFFDSSESSYDSHFSDWIDESSKFTTLTNTSLSKTNLSPIQPQNFKNSLSNIVYSSENDSFKHMHRVEEISFQPAPLNVPEENDSPSLESQKSPTFKQTVSTPKNKSSNILFCGNTSPILSKSSNISQNQPENFLSHKDGNKSVPKNWIDKWCEIRSNKKQTHMPEALLAKEKHPNCAKNPFSPLLAVRQKLLPVLEMTELESETPFSSNVSVRKMGSDKTPQLCGIVRATPLRQKVLVGGGGVSETTPRDPLSSFMSVNKSFEKKDSAVSSINEEESTAKLTKDLQEKVFKLLEENKQNQNLINNQSMTQQKLQMEIENLTESMKDRDEIICSIYKNNYEKDRFEYFKNMDSEKLIKNHIKLQNMYHTLKFLYDDAVKIKDSLKQQLNHQTNQNKQSNFTDNDELETMKFEDILKKYEKIKAEKMTTEKQKSELIEKLKKQKEEIQNLQLLCEQKENDSSEESIKIPETFIYESSQNDSKESDQIQNESIQEIKVYKRKTIKIQNSKIFYKKGFDPRVFEESKNMYIEFKRRVKEQEQLDTENSANEEATKPPEGVSASQAVELEETTGPAHPTQPSKYKNHISPRVYNKKSTKPKRIQISPRFSDKKSKRQICWYYLQNMCKFGNQCRNKHEGNTDIFISQNNFTTSRTKSNKKVNFQTENTGNSYQNGGQEKISHNSSLFNGYGKNVENFVPPNSTKTSEKSGSLLYFDITGYHSVPSNQHFLGGNTQF